MNASIMIKNLNIEIDNDIKLTDINLMLYPGECFGIIGKSSSGKSTLAKAIVGLSNINRGKILFYNREIEKYNTDIMKIIGYVPDKPFNFPNTTIINFFKKVMPIYQFDYTDNLNYLAKIFKLDLTKKISNLSHSELQKVSIIYALFHDPKIIILDKPTANMDSDTIMALKKELINLKNKGKTILILSNQMTLLRDVTDKVYLLENGTLKETNYAKAKQKYKKVSFKTETNIDDFYLDGIYYIKKENDIVSIIYQGDLTKLLKALISLKITDLYITDPSIKEMLEGFINED